MNLSKYFLLVITLALLPSCNSGKESKASAFLYENNRRYGYTETALVGTSGNRIPFFPYQYATLYGALDTLETKSSATIVPPWAFPCMCCLLRLWLACLYRDTGRVKEAIEVLKPYQKVSPKGKTLEQKAVLLEMRELYNGLTNY